MLYTESRFMITYVENTKLSPTYKDALLNALSNILDYKNVVNKDFTHSDMSNMLMLAKGQLRSARSKAVFDDLYKFDYEWFEHYIINNYEAMLLRCVNNKANNDFCLLS